MRNDRPFLLIPYEYEGVPHCYEPDYLVRLKNGKTLVLEIKGEEDDQDRAKHQAAQRWVMAVNNWGRLGVWDFLVCRDAQVLPGVIAEVSGGGGREWASLSGWTAKDAANKAARSRTCLRRC